MSELYQVEEIIGKRITQKGKTEYKVKWKGYSETESTWQPYQNLIYVKQMIKDYESRLNQDTQNNSNEQDSAQFAQNQEQTIEQLDFDENFDEEEIDPKKEVGSSQVVQYQESNRDKEKEESQDENQAQNQIQSIQSSEQSVFQTRQIEDDSFSNQPRPYRKKKKGRKSKILQKPSKNRQNSFLLTPIQNLGPKKKVKTDNNTKTENDAGKKAMKSKLQKIEENIRYHPKSKEKSNEQRKDIKNIKPIVKGINYNEKDDKKLMYLTEVQGLMSYKARDYMMDNWPDQLLKFYESRIDFSQIPKISR